jgi:hypothetical protein
MNSQRGVVAGRIGIKTTALAANAPIKNCPSAPMFQMRMRNASEQARPTSINGMALTIVSENTPQLPNADFPMLA